uniref:Uncharacterized protein n=1 Tax=Globodera pallida TaxID=36090 RepID=A0A183CA92_GLOPA
MIKLQESIKEEESEKNQHQFPAQFFQSQPQSNQQQMIPQSVGPTVCDITSAVMTDDVDAVTGISKKFRVTDDGYLGAGDVQPCRGSPVSGMPGNGDEMPGTPGFPVSARLQP